MTVDYLRQAKEQLDRDLVSGHPLRRVADELLELRKERDEARAEVVYLRRQIQLDENWMDPEFGGCTPDPDKPPHLKEAS